MSIEFDESLESSLKNKVPARCDGCPRLGGFVAIAASLDHRLEWRKTVDAFQFTAHVLQLASLDQEKLDQEVKQDIQQSKVLFEAFFGVSAEEVFELYPPDEEIDTLVVNLLNGLEPSCEAEFGELSGIFESAVAACPANGSANTCAVKVS